VQPVAADAYPATPPPAPAWASSGQPCGQGSAPILVRALEGPLRAVGPDLLQFHCDALSPAGGRWSGSFLAYRTDDGKFRHTELVGMPPRGYGGLSKGAEQTLTLGELPKLNPDGQPLVLNTSSSAQLPVSCYVAWGPGRIVDGKLHVADFPTRVKKPIPLRVVAWQFGSAVEPLVKPAAPVSRDTVVE
jgi:hypothetical protein